MADNMDKVTPELLERAKACRNEDEVVELLKGEGIEIPDEALDGVAGGWWCAPCSGDGSESM